jgi:hypothetical protein
MTYDELLRKTRGFIPKGKILGIDPGETTGVAVFLDSSFVSCDQLKTKEMPLAADTMSRYIMNQRPDIIVMEAYRIYNWKTRSHANSDVHTLRLIGAIQYIAYLDGIPVVFQGAGEGKGFCTNEKLEEWGFYSAAKRHAMDATRHIAHYLLFNKEIQP